MRLISLLVTACIAMLGTIHGAGAEDAWNLEAHASGKGKTCTLSRLDQGRPFSVTLKLLPGKTDQGVVGLAFDEPTLIQGAKKALAMLKFDNGTNESHRIEVMQAGHIMIPIIALNLPDTLQTFSQSSTVTVATRYGSTSFDLDGIGDRIPDLRACAGS